MWVLQDPPERERRPWQGRGPVKGETTPAEAHTPVPGRRLESAVRQLNNQTSAGDQMVIDTAGFGLRNKEIGTFTTLLPSLLKMTTFPPLLRRKRSARTGGGHLDDPRELAVARTNRSRRPHSFRFVPLGSAIFTFLGNFVVYPPANLGASSTNFRSP